MEPQPSTRTSKLQHLFELAASQAGHFTAAQARQLGYSARSLVHHVQAGHVDRVSRGFYRLKGVPEDRHEDVIAAWLRFRARQAVVSHDTALTLYDLAPSQSREIHLTLPRKKRPRSATTVTGEATEDPSSTTHERDPPAGRQRKTRYQTGGVRPSQP